MQSVLDAGDGSIPIDRRARGTADSQPRFRIPTLAIWMALAIISVAGLAYWDEQREARVALDDFADDQAWLAEALSRALAETFATVQGSALEAAKGLMAGEREVGGVVVLANRSAARERASADPSVFLFDIDGPAGEHASAIVPIVRLLASIRFFPRRGDVHVVLKPSGRHDLVASDGSVVRTSALSAAFASGLRSLRVSRAEAVELGLPPRMAMAGLARIDAGALGPWHLAVVATAQAERDRAMRAQGRLVLGVGVVASLVIAFGAAALRTRTKALDLRHALAIHAIETERDERLVRADKLATLGALAMGIAHEVSTPLGVILVRAEQIAASSEVDERTRRSGEMIVAESQRISEVIRGFLALARGNAPRLEDAQPAKLAQNAIDLVSHRFAKGGINLSSRLDSGAPPVACDPRLFEQVLVNLLLNACDACGYGGNVEMVLRSDRERVAFLVTDDGEGILNRDAARATEPFFTTKAGGTGLGLAITNEIVKHHRGSLVLRPSPTGCGTQAVVELPVSPTAHAQDAHA